MKNKLSHVWSVYKETVIIFFSLGIYVLLAYLLHIPCPFRFFTGIPCPGCGMTRAYITLLEGDVMGAFAFHPLWPLIPVAGVLLAVFHGEKRKLGRNLTVWVTVLLMIGVYLYRVFVLHDPVLAFEPENSFAAFYAEWLAQRIAP